LEEKGGVEEEENYQEAGDENLNFSSEEDVDDPLGFL